MTMEQTVVIEPRFNGPPSTANGGYAAGVVAQGVTGPATVTLRVPPPLDQPMTLVGDGASSTLVVGETLVGEAVSESLDIEVPPPPSLESATEAATRYIGFESHIYATCFVCGPERASGDGLRIFAGAVGDTGVVAAPWVPDDSLVSGRASGEIDPRFVWAALDCPSYFGIVPPPRALLGRLSADIRRLPEPNEPLVAFGWPVGGEGRKHFCGSALATEDGEVIARAASLWIRVKP